MKRFVPYLGFVAGIAIIWLLLPRYNAAQPKGITLTRSDAVGLADAQARKVGIPVDRAWSTLSWVGSPLLEKQLDDKPELRRRAADDPVIGPRLGGYRRTYYRRNLEKSPSYGEVVIDAKTGGVLMSRVRLRNEEPGAKRKEADLRPRADAFVRSQVFPGAPSPQFESARSTDFRSRTDWIFRYRIKTAFPVGNVVPYLYVFFAGDRLTGWSLIEEYADGSAFRSDSAELAGIFARYAAFFAMLVVLLVIFLRKYHAGEVGVGTATVLFALIVVLSIAADYVMGPSAAEGSQTGGLDALQTALAYMAFKFLLYDLVVAVLVFFAWSVGESYARERWGERLASFDSILRRDPFNATAGRSILTGALLAPAVAAAAFVSGAIPLALKIVHPTAGIGTEAQLFMGGPALLLSFSALDAIIYPILALFLLAWTARRRRSI